MLHTLLRAFLIPLIAVVGLVVFGLALTNTIIQAHVASPQATILSDVPPLTSQYQPPLPQAKMATAAAITQPEPPVTYTIHPIPPQKLRQWLAGRRIVVSAGPSITFLKTVGLSADDCYQGKGHELIVAPATLVTYCYIALNTGTVTFTNHTVIDEQLGVLANDRPYDLTPFGTENAAAFLSVSRLLTTTGTSKATWTAKNGAITASGTDQTRVIVPTIEVNSTIVANSQKCGRDKSLRVARDTSLLYCYRLKNTSPITLPVQTLVDSTLGKLLENQTLPLAGGASVMVTRSVTASHSSTSVVTWTSSTTNNVKIVASDVVTVQVPASIKLTIGASLNNDACGKGAALKVNAGSRVVFCYLIQNNGDIPFVSHSINDTLYGSYDPFTSTAGVNSLLAVSLTKVITQTTVNTVTWTAYTRDGTMATSQAVARIAVTPTATIDIGIYYDVDRDHVYDRYESGIPNVAVTITSPTNRRFTGRTSEGGSVQFTQLTELGRYTVTIDTASLPKNFAPSAIQDHIVLTDTQHTTAYIGYKGPDDADQDKDGIPDYIEGSGDTDADGIPDYLDIDGEVKLYLPSIAR